MADPSFDRRTGVTLKDIPEDLPGEPTSISVSVPISGEGPALVAGEADPLVGRVVHDRYRIERVLGQGGFGRVYEARHVVLGTRLALKALTSQGSAKELNLQRLLREAQAAAAIGHPNVVGVQDFGYLPSGSAYLVMPLVEGRPLDVVTDNRPQPWRRVARLGAQLADALAAAHAHGIVHRDLKPENLMVVDEGEEERVKVLDFGIAKVQGARQLTLQNMVVGTPYYMSPEQVMGREVDARSDVYALGCILYELLAGAVPFVGGDPREIMRQHMVEPVPSLTRRVPDASVPAALLRLVERCLEKEPGARPQSMAELRDGLTELGGFTSTASWMGAVTGPPARATTAPAPRSRLWLALLAGFGAFALVATAGLLVVLLRGGAVSSPPPPGGSTPAAGPTSAAGPPGAVPPSAAVRTAAAPTEAGSTGAVPTVAAPAPDAEDPSAETPSAEAPAAQVQILSWPPGAVVWRGGEALGPTPLRVPRPAEAAEAVEYELRLEGYEVRTVRLGPGSHEQIQVALEVAPARPTRPAARRPRRTLPPPTPRRLGRSSGDDIADPWNPTPLRAR